VLITFATRRSGVRIPSGPPRQKPRQEPISGGASYCQPACSPAYYCLTTANVKRRHELVHLLGSPLILPRYEMAIEIQGNLDPLVAQTPLDGLDVHALSDEDRRVGVAESVERKAL